MLFRTSHLAICVTDLNRSIHFYQALGFSHGESFELPAGDITPINTLLELERVHLIGQFMQRPDGATIELLEFKNPVGRAQPVRRPVNILGLTHLSYYVDDLELAIECIEASGGTAHRDTAAHFGKPGMKAIFCTDPDGTRIELMQRTP